jgi:hypothetical protein
MIKGIPSGQKTASPFRSRGVHNTRPCALQRPRRGRVAAFADIYDWAGKLLRKPTNANMNGNCTSHSNTVQKHPYKT